MGDEGIEDGGIGIGAGIPRLGRDVGNPRHDLDAGLILSLHALSGGACGASTIGAGKG